MKATMTAKNFIAVNSARDHKRHYQIIVIEYSIALFIYLILIDYLEMYLQLIHNAD